MGTGRYILRKAAQALATLFFVICFNFFLFRMMPSNPAQMLAKTERLSAPQRIQLIHQLGLDKPLPQQFFVYLGDLLRWPPIFGRSFIDGQLVTTHIADAFWSTVLLVGTATLLSTGVGLLLGIYAGWRRGSKLDLAGTGISLFFYSMPEWWLGLMLLVFAANTRLFPVAGESTIYPPTYGLAHVVDVLNHMFLPCLTLVLAYLGEYSLIMRSSLLDVLGEDYITTARAKGLRENRVLWSHTVPNALLPTVSLVMLNLGFILSGAITIETVFSWPGLGLLSFNAISQQDYPTLQAVFLLFSFAVIIANLIADFMYPYLDPRVKEA